MDISKIFENNINLKLLEKINYRIGFYKQQNSINALSNLNYNDIVKYYDLYITNKTLKNILDDRIGIVYGQELPLYSDHLGVAGRVDCVAEFDGKLSITLYNVLK